MLRKWVAARERRADARLWAHLDGLLDDDEQPLANAPASFVLPDATWTGVAFVTDLAFFGAYNAGHRGPALLRVAFDTVQLLERDGLHVGLALDDGRLIVVDLIESSTTDAFVEAVDRHLG